MRQTQTRQPQFTSQFLKLAIILVTSFSALIVLCSRANAETCNCERLDPRHLPQSIAIAVTQCELDIRNYGCTGLRSNEEYGRFVRSCAPKDVCNERRLLSQTAGAVSGCSGVNAEAARAIWEKMNDREAWKRAPEGAVNIGVAAFRAYYNFWYSIGQTTGELLTNGRQTLKTARAGTAASYACMTTEFRWMKACEIVGSALGARAVTKSAIEGITARAVPKRVADLRKRPSVTAARGADARPSIIASTRLKAAAQTGGIAATLRPKAKEETGANGGARQAKPEAAASRENAAASARSVARAREEFIANYETKILVDETQNRAFIAAAEKIPPEPNTFFFHSENARMKDLNKMFDKSFVTALSNLHKQRIMRRMTELRARNQGLEIEFLPYSDFKAMAYGFKFKGKVPLDIEVQISKMMEQANNDFALEVSTKKLVRETDKPGEWFRAGMDQNADVAGSLARTARELPGAPAGAASRQTPWVETLREGNFRALKTERAKLDAPRLGSLVQSVDGANIPKRAVFDLARRFDSNEKLAEELRRRFNNPSVTAQDAAQLREYISSVTFHDVPLRIPKRVIVALDEAKFGGFSADLRNLGAAAQEDLAKSLLKATSRDQALVLARESEQRMTSFIKRKLAAFERIVGDIAKCSGDDCIGIPTSAMSKTDRQELLRKLNADPDTREIRVSFIGEKIAKVSDRSVLASDGELIEKTMRETLEKSIPADRLDQITFGIEMDSTAVGQGQVRWMAGVNGAAVSTEESATISRALKAALEKENARVRESREATRYLSTP